MMPVTSPPKQASTRGFWFMRDIPTLLWIVALIVVAFIHRWLPMPSWLLLHLMFLGVATHSILVWSQYFATALTRSPHSHSHRLTQTVRLILANLGTVTVLVGVPWAFWPVTVAGVTLIGVAVIWHGASLWRKLRAALPGRFTQTVQYYLLSAVSLTVGAVLGAWAAHPDTTQSGLKLAHALVNILGWIGVTVAGTIVTLWPTMLRTRAHEDAAPDAARTLPLLGGGVLLAALGAVLNNAWPIAVGLSAYALGLVVIARALVQEARRKPPRTFATLSAGAALLWWFGCLLAVIGTATVAAATDAGIGPVQRMVTACAPYFAAGFAAQIVFGALSYLIPVVMGGGPTPVRVGTRTLDSLANFRVAATNTALLVCALPVSSITRVIASLFVLVSLGWTLPLIVLAISRQRQAKREGHTLEKPRSGPIAPEGDLAPGRRAGQAIAGLTVTLLLLALGAGTNTALAQPVSGTLFSSLGTVSGGEPASEGTLNAPEQRVTVEARNMRFSPSTIEVPAGTRLIIDFSNTDEEQIHDLVFANGAGGERLAPDESTTVDVGVITENLEGWCSIVGHKQMGMTLDIVVTGAVEEQASPDSSTTPHHDAPENEQFDLQAEPSEAAGLQDAELAALPSTGGPVTHRIDLPVTDEMVEVAPGATQTLWTFGGTAPGPLLHGRVGDTFEVTLSNDGSIGHSIDFHAGALAPNEPMRTIAPGESLTYTFTATRAGIWMYHCATEPMSAHIANGMYGAVIIEPDDLPAADRSYALVQGEYYLGDEGAEVDIDQLATGSPDLVAFNGYANQYVHEPLTAKVGERVRVWVLDAGPNRPSSFHIIGGQFDTVWFEGDYLLQHSENTGSQALALQPAQGGFVELEFPEAGDYPFVSHVMIDAERGAKGLFHVTN